MAERRLSSTRPISSGVNGVALVSWSRDRRGARARLALACALVMALLATACSDDSGSEAGPSVTTVPASVSVMVEPGAGPVPVGDVLIERPAGQSPVEITASPSDVSATSPEGTAVAGIPVALESSIGHETGPIWVGLAVPTGTDPATVVVASVQDGAWVAEPTTYDANSGFVFAETDHLSIWGTLVGKVVGFAREIATAVNSTLLDATGLGTPGSTPDCGPDALDPSIVSVRSLSSKAPGIEWCAKPGDDGSHVTVRIVNHRTIGMDLALPDDVRVAKASLPGAADLPPALIQELLNAFGPNTWILPSGGQVDLSVPASETTTINATLNNSALVWSMIYAISGRAGGDLKIVESAATGFDGVAAVVNLSVSDSIRLGITEGLEAVGEKAADSTVRALAKTLGLSIGLVVGLVRGTIESFDTTVYPWEITIAPASGDAVTRIRSAPSASVENYMYSDWGGDGQLLPNIGDEVWFETPSGNIVCGWFPESDISDSVTCDIEDRANVPPPPSDGCGLVDWYPYAVTFDSELRDGVCTGGVVAAYGAAELPYGQVLRYGPFGCLSDEGGVTCIKLDSGRGFTVNRQTLTAVG
jgi:hypothetical protein